MSDDDTAHIERPSLAALPHATGSALFAAAGFALFLVILIETRTFSPEAQPFPRLIAFVGLVAAGLTVAQSVLKILSERRKGARLGSGAGPTWKDIAISYAGPPVYGALLLLLGFWIASAAFLMGLLAILGERRLPLMAAITAGTLGVIFVIFQIGFGIRLPSGLLI